MTCRLWCWLRGWSCLSRCVEPAGRRIRTFTATGIL